MSNDRYARGLGRLSEIHGTVGEGVLDEVRAIAPDFARLVVEFPYGDIHSRPGLSARDRQLAIVSALTAMGNVESELVIHMRAALRTGVTRDELLEVVMQVAPYAGFPVTLNAILAAKRLFEELDRETEREAAAE
ncbi:carboxymuconolactone decarboxylase family protein [Caenispirillum salinarum]|uniref:carboxymuconolactone decarboxylase family protein n=1 Tax=Caenispirillum salinarum TaxID=859058 RepID=UPI00384B969F